MITNPRNRIFCMIFAMVFIFSTVGFTRQSKNVATATLVDDFEGAGAPAPWTFSNGPEFPGASGSLTPGPGHTGKGAHLIFNFSQGGHYVSAELDLPQPIPAAVVAFWVKSPPGIFILLRVVDDTSQTLQYKMYRPLYAPDPLSWYHQAVDLASPVEYWGGANDGLVHGSIQHISILAADPIEPGASGSIDFDDVMVIDKILLDLNPFEDEVVSAPTVGAELIPLLGVNFHLSPDDTALDLVKSAGFTWIRTGLSWKDIEYVPGTYDFSAYDELLADLEARDMRALFILCCGNPLYTGSWNIPPTTPTALEAFGKFAEAAARHYAGRNVRFEIWNEPNISKFWPPQPDASQYIMLLKEALSSIFEGDPLAKVTTAGLAGTDFPFLRAYLPQEGSQGIEAVGVHPYRDNFPETLTDDLVLWRSIITQALPINFPTWDTEWGYSSTAFGDGHSLEARRQQGIMVARELLTAWSLGFPLIVYYELIDEGPEPYYSEHNFGLLAQDGSEKPAMGAIRTLTGVARERRFAGFLPVEPANLHALKLESASDIAVILWADTGEAMVLVPPGTTVKNLFSEPLSLDPFEDQLSLIITEQIGPVYLFFPKYATYFPIAY